MLRECGISDFVVVTGCYADAIEKSLGHGEKYGVSISYLHNARWAMGNGVSAYTFQRAYRRGEKFILLMADHLFEADLIRAFLAAAEDLKDDELLLAADRRLDKVYDLDECTKVLARGNYAAKLGKELAEFNAVDCGLFVGTGSLLEALARSIEKGNCALADAVNLLAGAGKVKLHFVEHSWIDVDDYESYKEAEKILLRSLVPARDGFISRVINRRFSLRLTRLLAATSITPNQVTFLSFLAAAAAAISFALGRPFIGGLLAQLASIIDGVDGEIARLKFLRSSFGEVFDSLLDRYGDCLIVMGMAYAWHSATGQPAALLAGAAALAGMPLSMLFKEKFRNAFGKPFIPEAYDGWLRYVPANRDGRLFVVMLGGVFNQLPAALVLLAAVSHLQVLVRLYKLRKGGMN